MMNELRRRVERLEQAAEAAQLPARVPVLLGSHVGESEAAIRDRHGVDADTRAVVVTVVDARRDGPRRETN